MTKEGILKNTSAGNIFSDGLVYDGFTADIYDAMEEYAKAEKMRLLEYLREELFIHCSTKDVYELFVKHTTL